MNASRRPSSSRLNVTYAAGFDTTTDTTERATHTYGWAEPNGFCDVRDAALIRDGEGIRIDGDCSITAGTWLDPYTGRTLTDPSDVDIDHVVPLANAWRSGASSARR